MLGKLNMREDQNQFLSLVGQPPARLTVEQAACGEKASGPSHQRELSGGARLASVFAPGRVSGNGGMDALTESASVEPAFMDEKQLLAKLPISRRTLGNWKTAGLIPYIKIGRRCLYDWTSVHGALLRRQKGGQ
jgi:hypothetical protein